MFQKRVLLLGGQTREDNVADDALKKNGLSIYLTDGRPIFFKATNSSHIIGQFLWHNGLPIQLGDHNPNGDKYWTYIYDKINM